ncbi:MAG TPA: hypothetical protein VMZ91_13950 [Candidatus Paceibacterota bacterium]|nr:hypothetical protein [Candidatus Paceibacterota bacterium]
MKTLKMNIFWLVTNSFCLDIWAMVILMTFVEDYAWTWIFLFSLFNIVGFILSYKALLKEIKILEGK